MEGHMATNKFKNSTSQLVHKHAIGTVITLAELERAANEITNGANGYTADRALLSVLYEEDEDKRRVKLRGAFNKGGEESTPKVFLRWEDKKNGLVVVQDGNEHIMDEASPSAMHAKAVGVALAAKRKRKALNGIDEDELSDEDRVVLAARKEAGDTFVRAQSSTAREFGNHIVLMTYKSIGIDDATAKKLVTARSTLDPIAIQNNKLG
jgi:hypothetical protein